MSESKPIPIPAALRWRQLVASYAAAVFFAAGAAVIVWQWPTAATVPGLLTLATAEAAELRAPAHGIVVAVETTLLRTLTKGEVLVRIRLSEPEVAAASLRVARAELELLRSDLGPALLRDRLGHDIDRLRIDWLRDRVTLAEDEVQLQAAEIELARLRALHAQRLVTDQEFDAARMLRERRTVKVAEQRKLVEAGSVATLKPAGGSDGLTAAIALQEEKLRLLEAQLAPIVLRAPLDGIVTALTVVPGASVSAGEMLATVTGARPERLIGFMRQPVPLDLQPGEVAEVRRRGVGRRATAQVAILAVGHALEPIPDLHLATVNRAGQPELGLRVEAAVPAGMTLRPGEWADLFFRP